MQGKVVLVTGADGGLGVHVSQAFLDSGATVIGTSRKIQQSAFAGPLFTAIPAEISTLETARSGANRPDLSPAAGGLLHRRPVARDDRANERQSQGIVA